MSDCWLILKWNRVTIRHKHQLVLYTNRVLWLYNARYIASQPENFSWKYNKNGIYVVIFVIYCNPGIMCVSDSALCLVIAHLQTDDTTTLHHCCLLEQHVHCKKMLEIGDRCDKKILFLHIQHSWCCDDVSVVYAVRMMSCRLCTQNLNQGRA